MPAFEMEVLTDEQIAEMKANLPVARTRNSWLKQLAEFKDSDNTALRCVLDPDKDTSIENHYSGYTRAAAKLDLNVEIIKNKDQNLILILKPVKSK